MKRRSRLRLAVAFVASVLVACGTPPDDTGRDRATADPAAQAPEMRTDLMVPDPQQVASGEQVALAFPELTGRGLGFVLEQRTDDGWHRRAYLTSAPGDGPPDEPAWHPADEEVSWDSLEIGGPGPDLVLLPDDIESGTYRICTANALHSLCTGITIKDG